MTKYFTYNLFYVMFYVIFYAILHLDEYRRVCLKIYTVKFWPVSQDQTELASTKSQVSIHNYNDNYIMVYFMQYLKSTISN